MALTSEEIARRAPLYLPAIAESAGLLVLHDDYHSSFTVFDAHTAELRGRIPYSFTLREAAAKLAEIAGEMGALYALREEAKVASPGGKA